MYLWTFFFFCSCDSWDEGVEAARVIGGGVNRASVSLFSTARNLRPSADIRPPSAMYICVCVC